MTPEKKEKTQKIVGIVVNVLIWIFVAFSVLTTIFVIVAQNNKDGVPELFGKSFITIQSDSMEDTYSKGDLVFLTKMDDKEKREKLKPEMIVTFRADLDKDGDYELNTHRIKQINGEAITTQGDKEGAPMDSDISYGDILGVCTEKGKIKSLGGVLDFMRSSLGFFLCVVLPMLLFFLYELYNFISLMMERKMEKAAVSVETEEEIKRKAIEEYLAQQNATQAEPKAEEPQSQVAPAEERAGNKDENTGA